VRDDTNEIIRVDFELRTVGRNSNCSDIKLDKTIGFIIRVAI